MCNQIKLPIEFSIEDIDRELIARTAREYGDRLFQFSETGTPERDAVVKQLKELYDPSKIQSSNEALSRKSTKCLYKMLRIKLGIEPEDTNRGIWYDDARVDYYNIEDDKAKKNAGCIAAVCFEDNLIRTNNGFSILKVKNYGKTFNLCDTEPFHEQPISAGAMCTGFLVKKDIVATAAHFANEENVSKLRFVFGFKMESPGETVIRMPAENIYKGVGIVGRDYLRNGPDWALVKLDRCVEGQTVAKLSKEEISGDQTVYVLGHPCGLPLKCSSGARVHDIGKSLFGARLDIYSGNSGSPVFDSDTHEVIGIAVHGDNRDFRWMGSGWVSVLYPDSQIKSKGAECTRVSEFMNAVDKL